MFQSSTDKRKLGGKSNTDDQARVSGLSLSLAKAHLGVNRTLLEHET